MSDELNPLERTSYLNALDHNKGGLVKERGDEPCPLCKRTLRGSFNVKKRANGTDEPVGDVRAYLDTALGTHFADKKIISGVQVSGGKTLYNMFPDLKGVYDQLQPPQDLFRFYYHKDEPYFLVDHKSEPIQEDCHGGVVEDQEPLIVCSACRTSANSLSTGSSYPWRIFFTIPPYYIKLLVEDEAKINETHRDVIAEHRQIYWSFVFPELYGITAEEADRIYNNVTRENYLDKIDEIQVEESFTWVGRRLILGRLIRWMNKLVSEAKKIVQSNSTLSTSEFLSHLSKVAAKFEIPQAFVIHVFNDEEVINRSGPYVEFVTSEKDYSGREGGAKKTADTIIACFREDEACFPYEQLADRVLARLHKEPETVERGLSEDQYKTEATKIIEKALGLGEDPRDQILIVERGEPPLVYLSQSLQSYVEDGVEPPSKHYHYKNVGKGLVITNISGPAKELIEGILSSATISILDTSSNKTFEITAVLDPELVNSTINYYGELSIQFSMRFYPSLTPHKGIRNHVIKAEIGDSIANPRIKKPAKLKRS